MALLSGIFQKLSFPVSAVYDFLQGTFLFKKKKHFPCRSLLISKTYIKLALQVGVKALAECPAKNASIFLLAC